MSMQQPNTDDGSFADRLDTLLGTVADALDQAQDIDDDLVDDVRDQGGALVDQASEMEQQIDDHDTKLDLHFDDICMLESDIEHLEADLQDANPTPDADKSGSADLYQPETPIEQVVTMPESIVDDQLTANQRRARFVAADVRDYAESVPAGWTITSSALRRVLKAFDGSGHTQTVARVMEILDDLGADDARIVDRRGTRRIVFEDDLVARLANAAQADHDVVMEGKA